MNGNVPEIYWYLFWVGVAIVVEAFGFYMASIIHRKNMRVLDLLKSYADKGMEPPPSVAELLNKQAEDPGRAWRATPRGARLEQFTGFLFTGCVIGGVAWWLLQSAGPAWAVYPTVAGAVFFSVAALGNLLTALVSAER